ncbi:hypothetical protein CHUAL_001283 [Chamberlinius hualienensis]
MSHFLNRFILKTERVRLKCLVKQPVHLVDERKMDVKASCISTTVLILNLLEIIGGIIAMVYGRHVMTNEKAKDFDAVNKSWKTDLKGDDGNREIGGVYLVIGGGTLILSGILGILGHVKNIKGCIIAYTMIAVLLVLVSFAWVFQGKPHFTRFLITATLMIRVFLAFWWTIAAYRTGRDGAILFTFFTIRPSVNERQKIEDENTSTDPYKSLNA